MAGVVLLPSSCGSCTGCGVFIFGIENYRIISANAKLIFRENMFLVEAAKEWQVPGLFFFSKINPLSKSATKFEKNTHSYTYLTFTFKHQICLGDVFNFCSTLKKPRVYKEGWTERAIILM